MKILIIDPVRFQAGITTTLNSRCSVLAAANSVYGRWDETKGDQVSASLQRDEWVSDEAIASSGPFCYEKEWS